MGGGGNATDSRLDIPTALAGKLTNQGDQLSSQTNAYQTLANNTAGQMKTDFSGFNPNLNSNFSQYNPNLNTNFSGPSFGNNLDAFSQNVVSQGQAAIASQQAAQNAKIAQQFAGNPGVANILQAQGNAHAQLAGNPLLFQAAANQRARQGQEYQLGQQAQSLTNAAQLAQGQEGSRLQQLGNQTNLNRSEFGVGLQNNSNAALNQQLQTSASGLQSQQNLMAILGGLASVLGNNKNTGADAGVVSTGAGAPTMAGGPNQKNPAPPGFWNYPLGGR